MGTRRALAGLAVGLLLAGCTANQSVAPSGAPDPSVAPSASATPTATRSEPGAGPPSATATPAGELTFSQETYPLPAGSRPHDVAPAADGGVWYTAQASGELGWLDPESGEVREVALGPGSSPHGVIVGPDGDAWVTDSGQNAIVRVDATTFAVEAHPLPADVPNVNLNTAAFDGDGVLWFTGQAGWYGSLDPADGTMRVFRAPRGTGPYGIAATPDGEIWYASLAGSYLGAVDAASGDVRVVDPPTEGAGVRRVWSDSAGRLWVAEWFAGQVGVHDPADGSWREWPLPGSAPQAYAVYVDETDAVWLTDFGANAIVRFDPETGEFLIFPPDDGRTANVRQLLGRPGEVWGAESAADRLVVVRYSR